MREILQRLKKGLELPTRRQWSGNCVNCVMKTRQCPNGSDTYPLTLFLIIGFCCNDIAFPHFFKDWSLAESHFHLPAIIYHRTENYIPGHVLFSSAFMYLQQSQQYLSGHFVDFDWILCFNHQAFLLVSYVLYMCCLIYHRCFHYQVILFSIMCAVFD